MDVAVQDLLVLVLNTTPLFKAERPETPRECVSVCMAKFRRERTR